MICTGRLCSFLYMYLPLDMLCRKTPAFTPCYLELDLLTPDVPTGECCFDQNTDVGSTYFNVKLHNLSMLLNDLPWRIKHNSLAMITLVVFLGWQGRQMSCTKNWTSSWQNLTTTRIATTTTGVSHLCLAQGPYRLAEICCNFASVFQNEFDKRMLHYFQGRLWEKLFTFSIKYYRQLILDGLHLYEDVRGETSAAVLLCQAPGNGVYWYHFLRLWIEPITSLTQIERSTTMTV